MLIQIILSILIFLIIFRLVLKFKKTELEITKFLIWVIFWSLTIVALWIPGLLTQIANFFGIGRGADLIFYISLLIIFYLIFKIYIKFEKIEKDITKIVRKNTLEKYEN